MAKSKISIVGRILAATCTFTAAILMGINRQSILVIDHIFTAKYYQWNSFLTFVVVNSIACSLHFVLVWVPSGTPLWRTFAALDMLMSVLLMGSWGSALTCYEFLKYGSFHVGWSPICSALPKFCYQALGAIITSFFGFFIGFLFCCCHIHYLMNPLLLSK